MPARLGLWGQNAYAKYVYVYIKYTPLCLMIEFKIKMFTKYGKLKLLFEAREDLKL